MTDDVGRSPLNCVLDLVAASTVKRIGPKGSCQYWPPYQKLSSFRFNLGHQWRTLTPVLAPQSRRKRRQGCAEWCLTWMVHSQFLS
ncbi:hypothetical protein MKW98_005074 [Papaver atlanticum]|uniref:Uncharacterized protein n=1 Tax=Papaver atlanticum TaxID=357466 RepID=A0AAD4XF27_9MAGN|nr:hypothetical protein MKW98_005074 [Papaver atlanticum]